VTGGGNVEVAVPLASVCVATLLILRKTTHDRGGRKSDNTAQRQRM